MYRFHRDQRGQSLVIVLSLITILFLLGSALAVHASAALRATRASEGQGDDFYAADAATELGIWWQRNGKAGNPPAQTINGVTTSTTITTAGGGGGGCPTPPTTVFMTGFETGVVPGETSMTLRLGGATTGNINDIFAGSWGPVTSPVRTGSYALRLTPSTSFNAYATVRDPNGISLSPDLVARFCVRFDVLPSADSLVGNIGAGSCSGCSYVLGGVYYKASTGKWALRMGAAEVESNVTVVAGTWHCFDLRMQPVSTTRFEEWYVDGVAQPALGPFSDPSGSYGLPHFQFGNNIAYPTDYTAYFDDIQVSKTASDFPLGDIKISSLVPDGMGTHNTPGNYSQTVNSGGAFTAITSTSWQVIDDPPPQTSTTDFIRESTAGSSSYIESTFPDTTQTCIRAASAIVEMHAAGTSANNTKTSVFDGTAETVIWSGDASETSPAYAQKAITPGGNWSQSRINGLISRFGYGVDVNPVPYWDSLMIEYGWRTVVAGPATLTIVGTGGGSTVTTTYPDAGAGIPTLSTWTATQ